MDKSRRCCQPDGHDRFNSTNCGIEAKEGRDVATWDIPNAFIQTAVEELDDDGDRIVMKIRGAMVDMLLELDPKYEDFALYENGQKGTVRAHSPRHIWNAYVRIAIL